MKTIALSTLVAGILVAAAATSAILATQGPALSAAAFSHAGHDEAMLHGGPAGDHVHDQIGMQRPHFPASTGTVPSADKAKSLRQFSEVGIYNDTYFRPANGVSAGTGTLDDPFVIKGLYVSGDLYLGDTDACVEIAENFIDGQLSLNWNNQCVHVHHNFVRDLRVNENVPRLGMPTGGLIESNQIVVVGQIRHFDGEFRNNVIGPFAPRDLFDQVLHESPIPFATDPVVLNIDGWNEALFHHNTITGSVSLDLHGHHHGTGFLAPHSHYHGDDKARVTHDEDHTDRWTSVQFTDNHVIDPNGYGIRYDDENHAGDDRTAPSESNEMLEKPHTHHVKVDILRNEVEGAGIWVDVFGADDELHKQPNPGMVTIADNKVTLQQRHDDFLGASVFGTGYDANTAIRVWATKEVQFRITGNDLSWTPTQDTSPVAPLNGLLAPMLGTDQEPMAIVIDGASDADYAIEGNHAHGFVYGVHARQMDEGATWSVTGNDFADASEPVWYDDSVANAPATDGEAHQADEHDHGGH